MVYGKVIRYHIQDDFGRCRTTNPKIETYQEEGFEAADLEEDASDCWQPYHQVDETSTKADETCKVWILTESNHQEDFVLQKIICHHHARGCAIEVGTTTKSET
jgi:hypothetical protein